VAADGLCFERAIEMNWEQLNERTWTNGDATILMDNCPRMGGIHYLLYWKGIVTDFPTLEAAQAICNV